MKRKIAVLACGWSSYFLKSFIEGMQKAVEGKNTDIYLFNAYNYTEFSGYANITGYSIFGIINYEDYDGVIILSDLINNDRILERERLRIIKAGKPAIAINKKMDGISLLKIDNYIGVYDAITHLIVDHELKKLAYITGGEKSIDFSERYRAYRTALSDNGIQIDISQVYSIRHSNFQEAYEFLLDHVNKGSELPEVFVCASDMIALGLIKACEELKINVPGQLKIIGYDDLVYSRSINPSITTVNANVDKVGFEAVTRILTGNAVFQALKINSTPVIRESCGCHDNSETGTKRSNILTYGELQNSTGLYNQVQRIEEIFTEADDVFTLLTNLEIFFDKSHQFEGKDFAIFLKSDWSSVLINTEEKLPQNFSYGTNVQSIVSIKNDKKVTREMINTRTLIPSSMNSDESNLFILMPIYHHLYVHGYFVCKNNIALIDNFYGYTWTKSFGASIERFRKKNMYKILGQQYLKLSTKDALSGMLNRIGMEKIAKPQFEENKKTGLVTILFFVDINSMKIINDRFGHLHGDLAVKTIASAVLDVIPKGWSAIRYGGDEFLVVGNNRYYKGEDYAGLIHQKIAQKTAQMQLPYVLSASIGSLTVPPGTDVTLEQAVKEVDGIMYRMKQEYHRTHQ